MLESKRLFQRLRVALDTPTVVSECPPFVDRRLVGQRRQPVLGRPGFARRPLHQQPLPRVPPYPARIATCMTYPYCGKVPIQRGVAAFTPADRQVDLGRQLHRQHLDAERLAVGRSPWLHGWATATGIRGKGAMPGAHTPTVEVTPTTYCTPNSVSP